MNSSDPENALRPRPLGLYGCAAASELESQYPPPRLAILRGSELPFFRGIRRDTGEVLARAAPFDRFINDIAGAIDRYLNSDLEVAADRIADARRNLRNFFMERGLLRGDHRLCGRQRRIRGLRCGG